MLKKILTLGIFLLLIYSTIIPISIGQGDMLSRTNNKSSISNILQTISTEKTNSNWTEVSKITASDATSNDRFGSSISKYEDFIIIGAAYDENEKGSAYIFKQNGANWDEEVKLLASDGEDEDYFGESVSIDNEYAVVGAFNDDSRTGSVYIFKQNGANWDEEVKLVAFDGEEGDGFGYPVFIKDDYIIIGAGGVDNYRGAAYIFKHEDTNWIEVAKLIASDRKAGDRFGYSVHIEEGYAIIGAYGVNDDAGAVYIFKQNGPNWVEDTKLFAFGSGEDDKFGFSLAKNGDYLIVGACGDSLHLGAAYIFKKVETTWVEMEKLIGSDTTPDDYFGWSVSIYDEYAIVGGLFVDNSIGSAYLFKRDGSSWIEEVKLLASDGEYNNYFGYSVLIVENIAFVGAVGDNGDRGSVYVFKGPSPPETPSTPSGPTGGESGVEYIYTTSTVEPDGEEIWFMFDWGDGTMSDWIGPYYSDETCEGTYSWDSVGEYGVKVKAKDVNDFESDWSDSLVVKISNPPGAPGIDGPSGGKAGTSYTYEFTSTDEDGDQVSYFIEWGDGDISGWTAFQASGTPFSDSHTWADQGDFTITAKAKDENGLIGPEGTLTVTMPRNRATNNVLFYRLLESFPLLQRVLYLLK